MLEFHGASGLCSSGRETEVQFEVLDHSSLYQNGCDSCLGGGEQKGEDMFEVLASVMRPFFYKGMKSNEA